MKKQRSKSDETIDVKHNYRLLDLILPLLFLFIPFIPYPASIDEMGFQWLLMASLDIITCVYILITKNNNLYQAWLKLKTPIVYTYSGFMLCVIISILFANNLTDSVIQASRIFIVFVAFINMVVLYNHKMLCHLALGITIILFIEVAGNIYLFLSNSDAVSYDRLVLSIRGNMGIKNVLSAAIVWKMPFVFYYLLSEKYALKFFSWATLFLSANLLFILNTRSSFLSLLVILLIYMLIIAHLLIKQKIIYRKAVMMLALFAMPILLALGTSYLLTRQVKGNFTSLSAGDKYGTALERIRKIDLQEGSIRIALWKDALAYIQKHPLTGCGVGNWKIESIPFARLRYNDYFVPYHAHNDFLEYTAELGVVGGILFMLIIFFCFSRLYAIYKKSREDIPAIIPCMIMSMALWTYLVDAFFNFPSDRPPMQIYLFITLAGIAGLQTIHEIPGIDKKISNETKSQSRRVSFLYICILFILSGVLFISYKVHESLILQKELSNPNEIKNDYFSYKLEKVIEARPIPNINYFTVPIDAVIGNLLIENGEEEKAKPLLFRSMHDNPHLGVNELYLSRIYQKTGESDSAVMYAEIAFNKRPRSRIAYFNYLSCLSTNKDTLKMENVFREYIKYRNKYPDWEIYISLLSEIKGFSKKHLRQLLDSALLLFPDSKTELSLLSKRIGIDFDKYDESKVAQSASHNLLNDYIKNGNDYFNKGAYQQALNCYLKISLNELSDYAYQENIGLCYYGLKDYKKAVKYFEGIILGQQSTNGKAEFFTGMCYIMMGDSKKGCGFLSLAASKNYNPDELNMQRAYYCK